MKKSEKKRKKSEKKVKKKSKKIVGDSFVPHQGKLKFVDIFECFNKSGLEVGFCYVLNNVFLQ